MLLSSQIGERWGGGRDGIDGDGDAFAVSVSVSVAVCWCWCWCSVGCGGVVVSGFVSRSFNIEIVFSVIFGIGVGDAYNPIINSFSVSGISSSLSRVCSGTVLFVAVDGCVLNCLVNLIFTISNADSNNICENTAVWHTGTASTMSTLPLVVFPIRIPMVV